MKGENNLTLIQALQNEIDWRDRSRDDLYSELSSNIYAISLTYSQARDELINQHTREIHSLIKARNIIEGKNQS